jgi:hypothetical protein
MIRPSAPKPLDPLRERVCGKCGAGARFVGLESDPRERSADLCTYQCDACGHLQTEVIPHKTATNGAHRSPH